MPIEPAPSHYTGLALGAAPLPVGGPAESPEISRIIQPLSATISKGDEPLFLSFDLGGSSGPGLASGQTQTIECKAGLPSKWLVAIVPNVDANIVVYQGSGIAVGTPFRLGGGGSVKLPARSEFLAIVNLGTATAYGTIIALRKLDVEVTYAAPNSGPPVQTATVVSSAANPVTLFTAPGDGMAHSLYRAFLVIGGTSTVQFQDSTGPNNLSGAIAATAGFPINFADSGKPVFTVPSGRSLQLANSGSVQVSGTVWWV